jgi:twinkle protein
MFSTKLRHDIEFRPGEVTVWAGYNGHRKSMFTGQVALDLCVQRQRVLVASFEMRRPRRWPAWRARPWASKCRPEIALDGFARGRTASCGCSITSGGSAPNAVHRGVQLLRRRAEGEQVFIDSMMMVCASEERPRRAEAVRDRHRGRLAQETGLHVHLVAHCRKPQAGEDKPPTKYDVRGSAAISDQAHNVITVWANKAKKACCCHLPELPLVQLACGFGGLGREHSSMDLHVRGLLPHWCGGDAVFQRLACRSPHGPMVDSIRNFGRRK